MPSDGEAVAALPATGPEADEDARRSVAPAADLARRSACRPPSSRPGSMRRGDLAWVVCLVTLPVLAFAVPALVGHPVLLGDDLTQNEPLRALVGADLRHGQLPLLDPFLWSGTPLLGGWNAGASYPLTWLFALLPAIGAWTVGLVVTWWVAGLSFYALLRSFRQVPSAAGVGALSFAFGGTFLAQVVHVGLVVGMSWLPLQLLAVARITDAGRPRARWAAVLAASVGLTVLAGEPRAIDDALVVVVCFAAWRVARRRGGRVVAALSILLGLSLGVGLGAVQLFPGLLAVAGSQRAGGSLSLFASGSLPDRWLGLLAVPDLLGGSGSFRQPAFLADYNLTEVSGYVGALPVVGGLALLGRLRRGRPVPEWLIWHAVALVGVVLALGVNTPVGHLLARLPFYGGQRLQSRNLVVADVALAVLLGYFADDLVGRRGAWRDRRAERRAGGLAIAGAALCCLPVVLLAVLGDGWLQALRIASPRPGQAAALLPEVVPFGAFAALAGVVALLGRRAPERARRYALVGLVAANLAAFAGLVVVAIPWPGSARRAVSAVSARSATPAPRRDPAPPSSLALRASGMRPVGSLGLRGGRFAIYDPDLLDGAALTAVGAPDGNVTEGVPSVLGYGSIVGGRYAEVTGSHGSTGEGQDTFSPAAAANGVLDRLATTTLLTPEAYLVTSPGGGGPRPGAGTAWRAVRAGATSTWYFGGPLRVAAVDLPERALSGSGSPARPPARVGLVETDGRTRWLGAGRTRWRLGGAPLVAVGLRAAVRGGARLLGAPRVLTAGGGLLVADGQLSSVVVPPRWRYTGRDGPFAVFRDRLARPVLTLRARPGRPLGAASVRALGGPAVVAGAAQVTSPDGAVVVRAVSFAPGWQASWDQWAAGAPSGGSRPLAVRRAGPDGVLQAVTVPAGSGVVRWRYEAPGFEAGAWASVGSLAALVLLAASPAVVSSVERLRRRGPRVRPWL